MSSGGTRTVVCEQSWYTKGQMEQRVWWVDGKKHGLEENWYSNGQRRREGVVPQRQCPRPDLVRHGIQRKRLFFLVSGG